MRMPCMVGNALHGAWTVNVGPNLGTKEIAKPLGVPHTGQTRTMPLRIQSLGPNIVATSL